MPHSVRPWFLTARFFSLLIFVLAVGLVLAAQAQKVALKDNQITVDGKPYGQLVRSGAAVKDFSFRTLQGTEVFFAKATVFGEPPNATAYYTLTFLPSGQQATMERQTMNFGRTLAELVVANQLLTADGQPNPAGERRFIQIYGAAPVVGGAGSSYPAGQPPVAVVPGTPGGQRNAQFPLQLQGNLVVRGGEPVASVETEDLAGNAGLVRQVHIRLPDGETVVAEAVFEGLNATTCRLVTLKDNRLHALAVPAMAHDAALQIVQYLAGLYYL